MNKKKRLDENTTELDAGNKSRKYRVEAICKRNLCKRVNRLSSRAILFSFLKRLSRKRKYLRPLFSNPLL